MLISGATAVGLTALALGYCCCKKGTNQAEEMEGGEAFEKMQRV